jgi:hypothetical protein
MPVVSVTRLRVRSWRYLLPFVFFALRSSRQAKVAEGNLHVALLRDAKSTFWTRTVWTTDAAMKAFMLSGPHRQVMPRLLDWCDEAAVVHWVQDTDQRPDWHEAHDRLQQEGRAPRYVTPHQRTRDLIYPDPSYAAKNAQTACWECNRDDVTSTTCR